MQCEKLKTYMETGRVVFLPARAITPNPAQPRKHFCPEALEELTASIRMYGVLQPLSVRRVGTVYQLIAGERRLRAAIRAGLSEVPCILMQMDERTCALTAMVENLQRQDLSYIEQARGISQLMTLHGLSQEQVAGVLGKSQSAVANKLRLLRHSRPVLEALLQAGLTERHARALLRLPTEPQKLQAIAHIARLNLGVARAEQYITQLLQGDAPKKANLGNFFTSLDQSLTRIRLGGIPAISERRETDSQIVLTITIPKQ